MTFHSLEFLFFFIVVFFLYYITAERTKLQNVLLLVASYIFYAWANWKILPLLLVTTAVFYFLGILIFEAKTDRKKSLLTALGVFFGLGALLYFKYTNFFITSFKELFENIGLQTNLHTFNIILPVGISFYTFRLLSYLIDIRRRKCEPTRNIITFATYVAFFPCILSGPIDRPATLIPQIQSKRSFNYLLAVEGMRQILWGLLKKVVIADRCAEYVNVVFASDYQTQTSLTLIVASVFYSFQMYADFSGYSDMAIGVAKVLGFRVTKNFDYPFFAQNIAEFWRKWHISLTSWLTDYIFMPLSLKWRNWGKWGMILATIINFVLCGLWHGANWTFLLWGLYHGLLFIPLIMTGTMSKKYKITTYKWGFPKPKILFNILLTFSLVTLGLVFIRSDSIGHAFKYLFRIAFLFEGLKLFNGFFALKCFGVIAIMLIVEWIGRKNQFALETLGSTWKPIFRYSMYYSILFLILLFGGKEQEFIYFQF